MLESPTEGGQSRGVEGDGTRSEAHRSTSAAGSRLTHGTLTTLSSRPHTTPHGTGGVNTEWRTGSPASLIRRHGSSQVSLPLPLPLPLSLSLSLSLSLFMSQSAYSISHSASSFVALPVALPVALRFEPVGYSDECLCNVARQRVILDLRARREGSYLLTRLLVRDWRPPGHVNGHIPPLCARHYFGLNMDELRASLQALDECELPLEEEHYVRWGGLGRLDTGAAR